MSSVVEQPSRTFTFAAYAELVRRTAASYDCLGFEVLGHPRLPERFCILRHDIDMSPAAALRTAEIEAGEGVRANYAVLLTGHHYSPFERESRDMLRRIGALGHDLTLHFDAAWHGIASEGELGSAVAREAEIVADLVQAPVTSFSFHNTTPFVLSCREDRYGGLWNAYAGRLRDACEYTSDSNGFWRFRSWDDLLDEAPARAQILTHPEWWTEEPMEPSEKVCRQLDQRSADVWRNYRAALHEFGREVRCAHPNALVVFRERLGEAGDEAMRLWLSGHRAAALLELERLLNARGGRPEERSTKGLVEDLQAGRVEPSDKRLEQLLDALAEEAAGAVSTC